ncbi:hypothetical protein ACCO45_003066 [Purpureocillium lilacinum]|uniref:Uncharacterized protein n=1 Tax=Purpureocillium lilacinum TaxID=33203 RepID=A0ACC4DZS1_PURLI
MYRAPGASRPRPEPTPTSPGGARDAWLLAAERDAAEQQRRNNALMDVYGDRSSLEALEKAVEFYEKRR